MSDTAEHVEVEQQVRGAYGKTYLVWRGRKGIQIKGKRGKTCLPHCFYCRREDASGYHKIQQGSHTA